MTPGNYRIDFKELKRHVGVDDIAYSLGYRLDRTAGVGRYIELVLGDGRDRRDTIIVANPRDKAAQAYFRRDGSKGDVVTFIRENLGSFNVDGDTEWQKIGNVLAKFANMPQQTYKDQEYVRENSGNSASFSPERYIVRRVDPANVHPLFGTRGLTAETVRDFAPFLTLIRDTKNDRFKGFNIGFPYSTADGDTVGYEIRGNAGYKSKAAGTNSSEGSWVADFSKGNSCGVSNVYFFESAFDAMAFVQFNRTRLTLEQSAFVSLGGTFSDRQVLGVMKRFPEARAVDCFDNDLAGRIYALRLLCLVNGSSLKFDKGEDVHRVTIGDNECSVRANRTKDLVNDVCQTIPFSRHIGQWTAPAGFKDWNDCILGKRNDMSVTPSKYQRDANLAERRRSTGLKI